MSKHFSSLVCYYFLTKAGHMSKTGVRVSIEGHYQAVCIQGGLNKSGPLMINPPQEE